MKKAIEFALQDMQEALRNHDGGNTIDVDSEGLQIVLRWAEKHGLLPDFKEADRVKLNRKGAKNAYEYYLKEGALGHIYSITKGTGYGGHIRVIWDDDPKEEPYPTFVKTTEIERVYE